MADISARIKELRGPLTQREVGRRLDVTEGAIQRWERGINQPSLEFLHKIADATGASIDYITGRSDDWSGHAAWWPGPESPTADLDAAVKQRERGDERRRDRSSRHRP